ncbi:hypothetical protein AAEX28_12950 [Lentisphaerota bacterium WC36G]|nr:hypothetical protein LJT99_15770 [Lentisphaerae bacterium WC36]
MFPVTESATSKSGIYTPTVWSNQLLAMFYASTCLGEIANTDYQGEIQRFGDKIVINELHNITIRDYVKGQTPQTDEPATEKFELDINKGKYFQFPANSVDLAQSQIDFVNKWTAAAASDMKVVIEKQIFEDIYSSADENNKGATAGVASAQYNLGTADAPIELTKENIVDFLLHVGAVMDEQNVPDEQRSIVLPSWACVLLKGSDLRNASITGDDASLIRNGKIGMIDRLTVYNSNLLKVEEVNSKNVTNAFACHKSAVTFASQLTETETIPNPTDFGKLVRGLQVYGYKVVKPAGMVHCCITKG